MKKRFITMFLPLFALALCACLSPVLAVEEEPEYYWYMENAGGGSYLETADQAGGFFLSLDGGGSYAELPEVRAAAQRLDLAFDVAVYPLDNGGLRVEARDIWSTKAAFSRDYSAEELAKAMEGAVPTTVRVLCTNGSVTVGLRYARNMYNGDWTQGNYYGWAEHGSEWQLVWSADGVTWSRCDPYNLWSVTEGWWDGSKFRVTAGADQLVSADGIHWEWTGIEERKRSSDLRYACELGKYYFEVVDPSDWQNGNDVYLMDQTSREVGVLLPDLGNAIRAMGIGVGDIQAWYTPDDTVTVAVYDYNQGEEFMYSLTYPISSLDWCLENLSKPFRTIEERATDGEVSLGVVASSYVGYYRDEGALVRNDGSGWKPVEKTPWGNTFEILPYNGKTFMVRDTASDILYASEKGENWVSLAGKGLGEDEAWFGISHSNAFAWTGEGYISCRRVVEYHSGRTGTYGEKYDPLSTCVVFLNESFDMVDRYDFGRQVLAVGAWQGTYYARVSNSVGVSTNTYDEDAGSVLYRSTDGKSWEETDYVSIEDCLASLYDSGQGMGMGYEDEPGATGPAGTADLGEYHFFIDGDTICVVDQEGVGGEIVGTKEAIEAKWIAPKFLSGQYDGEGNVVLTVRDLFTPSMTLSLTYSTAQMDEVIENGFSGWFWRYMENESATHDGTTVLALNQVGWLHSDYELIYAAYGRDESSQIYHNYYDDTSGKWVRLATGSFYRVPNVPWGGQIELLPYNGKTFMVRDRKSGVLYASADGLSWREIDREWAGGEQYGITWTGTEYMVCQAGGQEENGTRVLFLDGAFHVARSYDFGSRVRAVGFLDGTYYAWVTDGGEPGSGETLYRSADGANWEATDILQVLDSLQEIRE